MKKTLPESTGDDPVEILIVDDRDKNLLALEAAIQSADYRIMKANSGDTALRYLLDHTPALILLDVQMPKLDGYETAALIKGRERTRDIPIIFLTALNEEERFVQKGYEYGAVDYLTKPFDPQILKSKVKVFVELHKKTEQLLKFERDIRRSETKLRERKLAALELRGLKREQLQQKKYQELVEGIDHGIVWSANPAMTSFSYVGPTAERLSGFPHEQWLSESGFWLNHIHPDDIGPFLSLCGKAVEERSGFSLEHRFLTSEAKVVWLHTGVRVGTGIDTAELELRGLSVDISKSKQAEAALQKSKQRSDLLAQASLTLANSFDVKDVLSNVGRIIVPSFADWFSVDVLTEELVEAICLETANSQVPTPALSEFNTEVPGLHSQCDLSIAIDTGKPVYRNHLSERTRQLLSGTQTRANLMKGLTCAVTIPISIQGRSLGALVVGSTQASDAFDSHDLNFLTSLASRIAAALENARLYHEAQAAVGIRDEFLSIASHELKTPLTPLKLQIQQILRMLSKSNGLDQDVIAKLLDMSNRQIGRLSRLIEDLLDISRISRGQLEMEIEEFSFNELIQDIVQRFDRQLADAKCTISLDLSNPLTVHWDRFRVEQVVVNLLTNAIKYAPGKPIHILANQVGADVVFQVRDEGIGIAPEDQRRIFRRYERAVSQSHFGGMGLGLYIASQIIDLHQGKIRVESELGHGSTFTVEIPAAGLEQVKSGSQAYVGVGP